MIGFTASDVKLFVFGGDFGPPRAKMTSVTTEYTIAYNWDIYSHPVNFILSPLTETLPTLGVIFPFKTCQTH